MMENNSYGNIINGTLSNKAKEVSMDGNTVKTTLASIICSTGFIGNLAIIVLLMRRQRMHRPINWPAFNMAVCNLAIVMITIPYGIIDRRIDWPFGVLACRYLIMPIMEHFAAVCVLSHTAVGVGRYLIIHGNYRLVNKRSTGTVIVAIWILSFLVLSATLMGILGEFKLTRYNGKLVCQLYWISKSRRQIYRVCVFVLTYVIPTTLTGFSYQKMNRVITRSLKIMHGHLAPDLFLARQRKNHRMNSIFMTMFILFTLTTFPLQLFLFLHDFNLLVDFRGAYLTFQILMIFFYAQVVINPFVLFYMSDEYRKEIFRCCTENSRYRKSMSSRTGSSHLIKSSITNGNMMEHTMHFEAMRSLRRHSDDDMGSNDVSNEGSDEICHVVNELYKIEYSSNDSDKTKI